ncbi:hypothetical protein CN311_23165 [Mesorhizobium sanjuanii]|uniref:Uncharacterized protein n=1 Tax=Mesorhizobium sanjuanii TaxID=2037900 RepID=A0A2A6FAF2_9HYPH|nr:hypothetical protein [Mesorhizobium sanjuanii]PDQ18742.1 hypothetical protein CN311_23165 [Mesorhizobium sanjuanii]
MNVGHHLIIPDRAIKPMMPRETTNDLADASQNTGVFGWIDAVAVGANIWGRAHNRKSINGTTAPVFLR